jgi:hypothetical protein
MRTSIITAIGLGLLSGSAQAGTFHPVDVPSGQLTGLSQNGRVATGIAGASGWRSAKERGATAIDGALGVSGMSRWAQPIAGSTTDDDGNEVAALFHSNSNIVGPQLLGALPGGAGLDSMLSSAYDVSDNGIAVDGSDTSVKNIKNTVMTRHVRDATDAAMTRILLRRQVREYSLVSVEIVSESLRARARAGAGAGAGSGAGAGVVGVSRSPLRASGPASGFGDRSCFRSPGAAA